jgi:AcrR family transcriptional regulator
MNVVRSRRPKGHGEELRHEILAAAEQLLVETASEEAVSIRAVADAVGVTPPSIYRHFPDKQNLLFEVCAIQFTRLDEWLAAALADHDDPVEAIQATGRAYVEFGRAHPEHYRIMFMGRADLTPEQYDDEVFAEGSAFPTLLAFVERGIADGRLRTDSPAGVNAFAITVSLWAVVHGLTSLLVAKPAFPWGDVDLVIDTTLDRCLHGLLAR